MLKCTKNVLTLSLKKLLYHANVVTHCTYGALLWAPMINQTQINNINKFINKIVLCVKNKKKTNNYSLIYKELNILKLDDIVELELTKFMYKLINNMTPDKINNEFNLQPRHYNTRNRNIPQIITHTTNLYNKSFLTKSKIMFTRLPESVKNANNIKLFKKYFIKHKLVTY
jgi:hypothetical protein